jgi:hypothetical protein
MRRALLLGLVLLGAIASAQEPPAEAPTQPAWKALKVLPPTTTEDELQRVMSEMGRALRLKCTGCHEGDDYAKETPLVAKAREHLAMTIAINRDYFAYEGAPRIGCASCHKGRRIPR